MGGGVNEVLGSTKHTSRIHLFHYIEVLEHVLDCNLYKLSYLFYVKYAYAPMNKSRLLNVYLCYEDLYPTPTWNR